MFGLEDVLGVGFFFLVFFSVSFSAVGLWTGLRWWLQPAKGVSAPPQKQQDSSKDKGAGWRAGVRQRDELRRDLSKARREKNTFKKTSLQTEDGEWEQSAISSCGSEGQEPRPGKMLSHMARKKNKMASVRPWKFGLKQRKKIWIIDGRFLFVWTPCVFSPIGYAQESQQAALFCSFRANASPIRLVWLLLSLLLRNNCKLFLAQPVAAWAKLTDNPKKIIIIIIKSLNVAVGSAWIWIDLQIYLWNISWPLCLKKRNPKNEWDQLKLTLRLLNSNSVGLFGW